jgi:hypothetical protein
MRQDISNQKVIMRSLKDEICTLNQGIGNQIHQDRVHPKTEKQFLKESIELNQVHEMNNLQQANLDQKESKVNLSISSKYD